MDLTKGYALRTYLKIYGYGKAIIAKLKEPKLNEEKNITNNNINSPENNLLKEKLSSIDINIKALNGINKSMEKQIKDIEKDILDNQILITEPRNINISTKKLLRKNEKLGKVRHQ